MATRKYTLTIPESLAVRLDAYQGKLKLSTFLQERLTEFLDAEEAKAVAFMNERQALSNRVLEMVMHGEHGAAYVAGSHKGHAWGMPMSAEEMIRTQADLLLNPYPLELGRPGLLPKSLLTDDPRLAAYAATRLGPELTQALIAGPEPVFMLAAEKKDEALVWIAGWNDGLDEVAREMSDWGWMANEPPPPKPSRASRKRRPDNKDKP